MMNNNSLFIEIAKIASLKYGRNISADVVAVTLQAVNPLIGQEKDFVERCREILTLSRQSSVCSAVSVVHSEPETIVISSDSEAEEIVSADSDESGVEEEEADFEDELYEFGSKLWFEKVAERKSDDLALLSEIKRIPNGDITKWREWIDLPPSTFNSKRQRLYYVKKWSKDDKTIGLSPDDYAEVCSIIEALSKSMLRGDIVVTGIASVEAKKETFEKVRTYLDSNLMPDFVVSGYHIFGRLLPPRRTGDLTVFKIVSAPCGDKSFNYWIKSSQTFEFNSYKNSDVYGQQIFASAEVKDLCYRPEFFRVAIDWLNAQADGSDLLSRKSNPSFQFKALNNSLTVNCFRHFYETIVSPTLSKNLRARLNYYLCHTASTAEMFYRDE